MKKYLVWLNLMLIITPSVYSQSFSWNIEVSTRISGGDLSIQNTQVARDAALGRPNIYSGSLHLEYFALPNLSISLGMGLGHSSSKQYNIRTLPVVMQVNNRFPDLGLSIGARLVYEPTTLAMFNDSIATSLHGATYSSRVDIYNNFWSLGAVASYEVLPNIAVSAGYMFGIGNSAWKSVYNTVSPEVKDRWPGQFILAVQFDIYKNTASDF